MSLEFHDLEVGNITITATLEGGAEIFDGSLFVALIRPYKVGHNVNGWTIKRRDHSIDGSGVMLPTLRDAIKHEITRWRRRSCHPADRGRDLPEKVQITVTPDEYGLILGALFDVADVYFDRGKRTKSPDVRGRNNERGNAYMKAWHAASTSAKRTRIY